MEGSIVKNFGLTLACVLGLLALSSFCQATEVYGLKVKVPFGAPDDTYVEVVARIETNILKWYSYQFITKIDSKPIDVNGEHGFYLPFQKWTIDQATLDKLAISEVPLAMTRSENSDKVREIYYIGVDLTYPSSAGASLLIGWMDSALIGYPGPIACRWFTFPVITKLAGGVESDGTFGFYPPFKIWKYESK
jgi:hypothetical protein